MTEKQIIYADYLLKCLGFSGYQENKEYVTEVANYMSRDYRFINRLREAYGLSGALDSTFKLGVIDSLRVEYDIRRRGLVKFRINRKNYLSATDISSYVFCPVSFSIKNSIITIENPVEEEGTNLHENMMLMKFLKPGQSYGFKQDLSKNQNSISSQLASRYPDFFKDVSNSSLVFSGHTAKDSMSVYFSNDRYNYVGQPDYIFKKRHSSEHFVVEEKFHYYDNYHRMNTMFGNQAAQLASYISMINDPAISYGYLIHWVFKYYDNGNPYVHYADIKRIDKSVATSQRVVGILNEIKSFVRNGEMSIQTQQNSWIKCARCSLRPWCGHKTRQLSTLRFPYSEKYLKLIYQKFPDELRTHAQ